MFGFKVSLYLRLISAAVPFIGLLAAAAGWFRGEMGPGDAKIAVLVEDGSNLLMAGIGVNAIA